VDKDIKEQRSFEKSEGNFYHTSSITSLKKIGLYTLSNYRSVNLLYVERNWSGGLGVITKTQATCVTST